MPATRNPPHSANLRRADPNALFDLMAGLVAGGYAKRFESK